MITVSKQRRWPNIDFFKKWIWKSDSALQRYWKQVRYRKFRNTPTPRAFPSLHSFVNCCLFFLLYQFHCCNMWCYIDAYHLQLKSTGSQGFVTFLWYLCIIHALSVTSLRPLPPPPLDDKRNMHYYYTCDHIYARCLCSMQQRKSKDGLLYTSFPIKVRESLEE